MVYGVLKLLNFAHGDVYMVGAYIGYFVIRWFGGPNAIAAPVPIVIAVALLVSAGGTGALGVAIERFAYRPLRDAPRIAPLITALGISFFLTYSVQLMFGAEQRNYDTFSLDHGSLYLHGFDIGAVRVPLLRIITIVAAFVLM